jgi:anti-anti-sigma factor
MSLIEQKVVNDVVIKKVNLTKATKEHAEEFKILLNGSNNGYNNVIIDLSECRVIDSTFVSALAAAFKNKNGYSLKLVANHPDVLSQLELTGLVKIYETYSNTNEAVASFKN